MPLLQLLPNSLVPIAMLHSSSNLVGTVGILCSASTLIGILLFVPLIVYQTNNLRIEIEEMSASFKHSSDHVWDQILVVDGSDRTNQKTATTIFSRIARSPWGKHICQGCHSLTCAVGQPGPGGQPGPDGELGEMGKQGPPGEDGLDVQLQPEGDLPCVICPAGPPGQRGPQGERGRIGEQGIIGEEGPSGKPGNDGPPGNIGPAGSPGQKGAPGRQGQQGDQVIAGVGIKGPQGPPGPAGPKGPHGVPGKSSRDVGLPGKPGPLGPSGLPGAPGLNGEPGGFGPPGEPGEPASYCPSDCGVSHIIHAPRRK